MIFVKTHDCRGELIAVDYEGVMICNKCGKSI